MLSFCWFKWNLCIALLFSFSLWGLGTSPALAKSSSPTGKQSATGNRKRGKTTTSRGHEWKTWENMRGTRGGPSAEQSWQHPVTPGVSVELVSATAWHSAWRGGRTRRVFQPTSPAWSSMRFKNKLSHQDCLPSQEGKMASCLAFRCTVSKYLCSQSACSLVLLSFLVKFSCRLAQRKFWKPYQTLCMVHL